MVIIYVFVCICSHWLTLYFIDAAFWETGRRGTVRSKKYIHMQSFNENCSWCIALNVMEKSTASEEHKNTRYLI